MNKKLIFLNAFLDFLKDNFQEPDMNEDLPDDEDLKKKIKALKARAEKNLKKNESE